MIENVAELKKQLAELADVVNKFKSEAVQLRVIEHVLDISADLAAPEEAREPASKSKKKRPAKKKKKAAAAKPEKGKKTKRAAGAGAPATLNRLVDEDFFASPQTLKDIVDHCENSLARRFKQNEFSGKLARMVRDGVLKREKNADGQYEYTNA